MCFMLWLFRCSKLLINSVMCKFYAFLLVDNAVKRHILCFNLLHFYMYGIDNQIIKSKFKM